MEHVLAAEMALDPQIEPISHGGQSLTHAMLDNIPNPVFLKDVQGRYLLVNKRFESALGVARADIEGKSDFQVFDRGQAAQFRAHDLEVLAARSALEFEECAVHHDGPHLSIVHKFPLFDTAGEVWAIGGIATDITQRKRAEEALRHSEEHYRVVVETATDAVVSVDEDSNIVFANPATTLIFGYSATELVGQPLLMIMPERLRSLHKAAVERYLKTGKRHVNWAGVELLAQRKNGEEFPIEVSFGQVVKDGQHFFTGFIRDITQRKQAQEIQGAHARHVALRASIGLALAREDTLRRALQACTESVTVNLDAAFARIWTLEPGCDVLELQASAGLYTHLDGRHSRVPVGALKIGKIAAERSPLLTNDVLTDPGIGDKEWARANGLVAFAGYPLVVEGRVVGVLALFSRSALQPVTLDVLGSVADLIAQGIERKRTEERLQVTQDRLRESAQRLREMSARMQQDIEEERKRISQSLHDEMGQTLTALQLDASWIRSHWAQSQPMLEVLDRMQRSIEEGAAAMRRIVADMRPRILDDFGLVAASKGLVKDVAARSGLQITLESSGAVDDAPDNVRTALYRMLQECLTNVVRHARATTVEITMLARERRVEMSIADNGCGFGREARCKAGSFGLFGLNERAAQLGGSAEILSTPGKGTRVTVRLALAGGSH